MMKPVETWLEEYGESHRNPINKRIHWVCVPLIVLSLIGLLWSIPVPQVFRDASPILNWGMLFLMASIVYYFLLSVSLGIGMTVFAGLVIYATAWLDRLPWPLWAVSVAIFVAAWIGQFIGHRIEGRQPSFFKDIQFLMIGPMWLMAHLYRKVGIPYGSGR